MQVSSKVIQKLDNSLNKVIVSLSKDNTPMANSKCEFIIGDTVIKRENKFYNVYDRKHNALLYSNLFLIETALLISRHHNIKDYSRLKEVISLDNKYAKHYLDMKNYLHTLKASTNAKQYAKAEVAELRYRDAKLQVTQLREKVKAMSDQIIKNR